MNEKILIISFTNLAKDSRVNRQIRFLSKDYKVVAAGTDDPGIEGVQFVHCKLSRFKYFEMIAKAGFFGKYLWRYDSRYWSAKYIKSCLRQLSTVHPSLIIANDIMSLPLATKLSNDAKVR